MVWTTFGLHVHPTYEKPVAIIIHKTVKTDHNTVLETHNEWLLVHQVRQKTVITLN